MRILLASVLLIAACGKGKPTQSTDDKPGSAVASGGSAAPVAESPDVALPPQTGQPPEKTTAPLTEAQHDKLSDLQFPGWEKKLMEVNDKVALWRYTTKTAPKLTVTMMIRGCTDKTPCKPIELAAWKQDAEFKERIVSKNLVDRPDTHYEIAQADFNGTPMISTFVLGQAFTPDAEGNSPGTYKYAYGLFWNDGINSIQAIAGWGDLPLKDVNEMAKQMPREHLEASAHAFMDNLSHAWAKL